MIKLSIGALVFFYILFSVIVILIGWIFFSRKDYKGSAGGDADCIWKCSVCFNDYIDSKRDNISVCPLCGSYNKRGEQ